MSGPHYNTNKNNRKTEMLDLDVTGPKQKGNGAAALSEEAERRRKAREEISNETPINSRKSQRKSSRKSKSAKSVKLETNTKMFEDDDEDIGGGGEKPALSPMSQQ